MSPKILTTEDFALKLETLITLSADIAMLKLPDGLLRSVERFTALWRELVEHDAALRNATFDEQFEKIIAPLARELDKVQNAPVIGPHTRDDNVVFAEALAPLTGEDIDHLIRNHYPGCTLPPQHAGKCCTERGPHTCKR